MASYCLERRVWLCGTPYREESPFRITGTGAVAPETVAVLVDDGHHLALVEQIGPCIGVPQCKVNRTTATADAVDLLVGG